mgnify:CR=1 FL=1
MNTEPRTYETTLATLVRLRPDLVEVRYKEGITLTSELMAEVQEKRRTIMGGSAYGMITLLPGDIAYDPGSMQVDHLETDRREGLVMATAVVAEAHMIEMLVKIYFSYYPQLHRIHVTSDEAGAREWLEVQLQEVARTGT